MKHRLLPTRAVFTAALAALSLLGLVAPVSAAQHTVKEGDTLGALSRKYGVSVAELRAANGLQGDNIVLGKKLRIPKPVGTTSGASREPADTVQVRRAQPVNPAQARKPAPKKVSGQSSGHYEVQPGDSLGKLAARYGSSVAAIQAANGLSGENIQIGQSLVIPPKGVSAAQVAKPEKKPLAPASTGAAAPARSGTEHFVAEGDRLSLLARRYGVSVEAIRQANQLEGDVIRIGQLLVIPKAGTAVKPLAPSPAPLAEEEEATRRADLALAQLARATPRASAGAPVWENPAHYLDLVDLGAAPVTLPAPEAAAPSTPAPAPLPQRSVVVQEGDSLWKLSREHKVSIEALRAANGLPPDDDSVQIGQKLILP